jgi:hypothetical protein
MPKTRTDLHRNILSRIDEAINSEVGALQSGTSNTPTVTTTATLDILIDVAMGEIYRTCLLLPGKAGTNGVTAMRVYALDQMTATLEAFPAMTGSRLWWFDGASYNNTALTYASQEAVRRMQMTYRNTTAGTPGYVYRDGDGALGLYLAPTFTAGITAGGYCLPPSITAQTELTYMSDSFTPIIEDRVAELIVEKQFSDPSLFGRLETLRRRRLTLSAEAWNTIPRYTREVLGIGPPQ